MHAACSKCGRAACRHHMVAVGGLCVGCVDRCSHGLCGLLATKSCQRCQGKLCVTHRTTRGKRCAECERAYDTHLASKTKSEQPKDDPMDTILRVAGWIVATLVVSTVHWVFLPVGIYITAILVIPRSEPPSRLRRRERKRFLAEKLD